MSHPLATVITKASEPADGFPASPQHAEDDMPLTGHISQLDHLYWNTDLPVAEIAERLGLPANQLSLYTTPQPAGVQCHLCHADLAFTSRSQRNGQRLRCRTCGCTRRHPEADRRHAARHRVERWRELPANGSVILARHGHHNVGLAIESCLDALAAPDVVGMSTRSSYSPTPTGARTPSSPRSRSSTPAFSLSHHSATWEPRRPSDFRSCSASRAAVGGCWPAATSRCNT